MRLIIQTDHDCITLTDHPENRHDFWCIKEGGVSGLYGTPAVRESPTDRPQASGAYWPSRLTQKPRSVSIDAYVMTPSSLDAAMARERVNNLVGRELTLIEETPLGRRMMTGYLASDPEPTMRLWAHRAFEFGLVVTCPDPLKYGAEQEFPAVRSTCVTVNAGNAPTWPRIRVTGPVKTLSVRLSDAGADGLVVWQGDEEDGLDLDFRDMIPSRGIVTDDRAFPIPPGTHHLTVDTGNVDAKAAVVLRPAWR